MRPIHQCLTAALVGALLALGALAASADSERVHLPQTHEYQKTLRDYMATLQVEDFEHGVEAEGFEVEAWEMDDETLFREYVRSITRQPKVGFKRGIPAITAPAWLFLLSTIEGPTTAPSREEAVAGFEGQSRGSATLRDGPVATPTGIVIPPVWPDALISFVQWDDPGNHFHDNQALKMRAFVTAATRMIMLDDFLEGGEQNRSDWNAFKFVTFAFTFQGVRDLLPEAVEEAYQDGLTRLARRLLQWGVHGEDIAFDLIMPLAMWYATQTVNDPEVAEEAARLAQKMMTHPDHFHPAGYWVERGGGIEIGFAGMANNFAVWTALASDWPFAREAVARVYRLREHLILPDPDGQWTGPSHFNSRLGTPAHDDQWDWSGMRELGAFMVAEEAASAIRRPTPEDLDQARARNFSRHTSQIYGHMRNHYNRFRGAGVHYGYDLDENVRGATWSWRIWDTFNYPLTINYAAQYYQPGTFSRLQELERDRPGAFQLPYERGEVFLRNFGDAFFATRQDGYAAILHTGPVGEQDPDDGKVQFEGPMGFGGGQLSAFWTPETGSVILGLRAGMNANRSFDVLEEWRQWPLHAVSGITDQGTVFSSSRILSPEVSSDLEGSEGVVTVDGVIDTHPFAVMGQETTLFGKIAFRRAFELKGDRVRVETQVSAEGGDRIAELYETLPVLLQRSRRVADEAEVTRIEFKVGGDWIPATAEFHERVESIRLTRFEGAVLIRFSSPQRVGLSPEPWVNGYLPRGMSARTILIDLLGGGGPRVLPEELVLSYEIQPE